MVVRSQKTTPNKEAMVESEMPWSSSIRKMHFVIARWSNSQLVWNGCQNTENMHTTDVKNARAYTCVRVRTRSHVFVGVRMSSTKNNVFRGTQIKHKWPSSSCGLVWAYACPATKTAFSEERKSHHRNSMQTRRRQRKRYECKETYNNNRTRKEHHHKHTNKYEQERQ